MSVVHARPELRATKHSPSPLQGLRTPITDVVRLCGQDQRLYLIARATADGMTVLGGLKVGHKRLFIRDVRRIPMHQGQAGLRMPCAAMRMTQTNGHGDRVGVDRAM